MKTTLIVLLGALGLAGCGGDRDTFEQAPVILISIDTLRSDHLPVYGYKGVETPAIDALRRDGILFERAYSHVPLTLPSHTSMLTGVLPPKHGVRDNGGYLFDAKKHPYVPQLLKDAGYETAAFVSSFVIHSGSGLGSGFDVYDHGPEGMEVRAELVERLAADTAKAATGWLAGRKDRERPFFLFFHLYDPHAAYKPPEPFASRYKERPYDGEIAAADAAVGTLLDTLKEQGIYDKAVILLVSDHGEGFGEHGEEGHGILLYREALQVPMLLKLPGGRRAGESVAAPAQLMDVGPTILDLTGHPVPEVMEGDSLLALSGPEREGKPARRIYSETFYPRLHMSWSELVSLIEDRFQYIHGPTPELFDLVADPGQTRDLFAQERRVSGTLRQALDGIPRELEAPGKVDAETARRLGALGYSSRGSRVATGPLPDPRSKRAELRDLQNARTLVAAERWSEAADPLQRLVEREPNLLDAWFLLASCRERLNQPEETLAAYQRALELSDGAPEVAFYVARQLYKMGRFDEAAEHAELMLAGDPENRDAREMLAAVALEKGNLDEALAQSRRAGRANEAFRRDLGRALAESGRTAEALEVLQGAGGQGAAPSDPATLNALALTLTDAGRNAEAAEVLGRVLAAQPDNARARELLGMVSLRMGQPQQARAHLERALAIDRRLPGAWTTLGVALYELEGPEAALGAWRQALALDGTQYDALLNVGLVAAQTGRRDEARQALRRFVSSAPPQRFGPDIAKAQQLLREIGG